MHEINHFDWAIKPAYDEQTINEQVRLYVQGFYIHFHTGILYRRKSAMARRLLSTA